jgi:glycerol-3-phosphate dehydrogenase
LKRDLSALAGRTHDLLVVGGGVHGVAAAWDAAQRGLSVALVEREDFGAGVSWNSLKTVHGGFRYLQSADLSRLRESVHERRALLTIAPALVRPLPFLVPTYGHGLRGREALALGLVLNDLLSADRNVGVPADRRIPRARMLGREEVLGLVPGVPAEGLSGGALWHDAQVASTERLVVAFARAAASAGAALANHAEAASLLKEGSRVAGAVVIDRLGGDAFQVRARVTLNAAGPAAPALLEAAGLPGLGRGLVEGLNLVFERTGDLPVAVGAASRGRYLFLVPWRDRLLAGTAYAGVGGSVDADRFREEVARAFPWAGLEPGRLTLVHRGRLPGEGGAFGLHRRFVVLDHERTDSVPGIVSLLGVKLTTARAVAEAAVDLVGRRLRASLPACRTAVTPLPEARLGEGPLEARTRTAVRDEMALTLADALLRRLDLGTGGPPAEADLRVVEGVMAAELGWNEARRQQERASLAAVYPKPLQ